MTDHEHDYIAANEAYFDVEAQKNVEKPQKVQLARRVCNAIRKAYPELWNDESTEMMDFACGTGK
jgi:hypothetical protein